MTIKMVFGRIMVWVKRATGIGYRRYSPLFKTDMEKEQLDQLKRNTEKLVRDFGKLERGLSVWISNGRRSR